jgi:hypothetical protein
VESACSSAYGSILIPIRPGGALFPVCRTAGAARPIWVLQSREANQRSIAIQRNKKPRRFVAAGAFVSRELRGRCVVQCSNQF